MKATPFLLLCPWLVSVAVAAPLEVEVAVKPAGPWKSYPTRTVEQLPAELTAGQDSGFSQYGGLLAHKSKATGFFYASKADGRWWLVDPEGCRFLHQGIASVSMLRTPGAQAALRALPGGETNWAASTTALLHTNGFNGTGAWTDQEHLGSVTPRLAYTPIWNFMSSYGKQRGGTFQQPGHTGYPKDCIFVFDPGFEQFCDEHAKKLAAAKDDPWLLGHFSDNELPFRPGTLTNFLSLPATDVGQQAALAWLRARHGAQATVKDVTPADAADFLGVVVDRYFRIVSQAIKKYDPNHLFLGSRIHGAATRLPEVFKGAGPYLDVVAVNWYGVWTPDQERLAMWERQSGRPCLITEWYAKGMDSGLANTTGAGWVVKTQRDRGRFYQNFVLGLLESPSCVGWHWFKYIDNDPDSKNADPSNMDSNKGILSNRYVPYAPLLDAMKQLNERTYLLAEYFAKNPAPKSTAPDTGAAGLPK